MISRDHRGSATVPAALPPPAGFERFHASRRLLQSEQPTSTTAGSTNPRSALADTACPACAGPMGLRPHPPHRPLEPGDAAASTPARPLRALPELLPLAPAEVSRVRGRRASACQRLSFFVPRARFVPFGIPLARRRMRALPEGNGRSRELRPNPIRSDTSRHDIAAASVGDPMSLAGTLAGPKHADCRRRKRCRRTSPCHREHSRDKSGLADPRTSRFRGPPAASLPPSRLSTGLNVRSRRTETTRWNDPLARIGQHRSARLDALAACAARPSWAEGRFTRCSAKSSEISRTRGAFHR
jgi:hypothetical protein